MMINYDKELAKIDDIVAKFEEVVERELDKNIADLEGLLEDIIDDIIIEALEEVVDIYLNHTEEIIFDESEVRLEVISKIRDLLDIKVRVIR